jgi:formate hydrogenlyase subunit 4
MDIGSFLPLVLALTAAPLLLGVINRTKAVFAGRVGPPLFQLYYDLRKLLGKGAVYSRTTTWVFRAGPIISLAAVLVAVTIVPLGSWAAALRFPGDLVLFVYLLGLARVFTVLAALDTGSSFEGMGASREVLYAALAEPALLLGLAAIVRKTNSLSLSEMNQGLGSLWAESGLVPALVVVALMVVLLTENSRIPVDDPNTHLELTMIHEVMVLDHGGPDLAFIMYGAALKLWVLGTLLVDVLLPARSGIVVVDTLVALAGMVGLAVLVGVVESTMARLRLIRVPQLLIGATLISALAFVLVYGEAIT